jgi:cholesterol oxidase
MATRFTFLPSHSSARQDGAGITDWADELAPCYDQARRMLGVVRYPYMPTDVDRYMQQVAGEMGRGEIFNKAPVGSILAAQASKPKIHTLAGLDPAYRMHFMW